MTEPDSESSPPTSERAPTKIGTRIAASVEGGLGLSPAEASAGFDEIFVTSDGGETILSHSREAAVLQSVTMAGGTALFVLFIIIVLPALNLTTLGNVIGVVIGLLLLVGVGLLTQVRTRTTRVVINKSGVEIEQGTVIDREQVAIAWGELVAAELEPVNPTDGRAGMQLRLLLREGPPVDTFVNISVGDLTTARQLIVERMQRAREKRAR